MTAHRPYTVMKDSCVAWLGKVPTHWEVLPFFTCADEVSTPNTGLKENNLLSLSYGRIIRKDINRLEGLTPASFEGYNIIEANDIVFRFTDLQNDQVSLRSAISLERGIITSAYVTVRPKSTPRFFNYLMRAYDTTKVFYGIGGGIRQSMKFDDLKRLPVALPDEQEREVIADHLDRETARIDKLIVRKARFIELLTEKRQALITHIVTKGLNPMVKTKDSGVEWLGQVPEHWSVSPIKYIGRIGNGSTPSKENPLYWSETGFPWLNSSVVNQEEVSEAKQFVTELALHECHLPIVEPPAILVGITGQGRTRGMAAPLAFKATINQHLAFIRPEKNRISVDFLLRALQMAYPHLRLDSEGAGSTKGAITCEQLGCFPIPLPPLQEQDEITAHIEIHSSRIDTLINKTEYSISLLREHRTALITAAVTGKIDLRENA